MQLSSAAEFDCGQQDLCDGIEETTPPPATSTPFSGLALICDVVAASSVPDMILARYRLTLSSSRCKRFLRCMDFFFFTLSTSSCRVGRWRTGQTRMTDEPAECETLLHLSLGEGATFPINKNNYLQAKIYWVQNLRPSYFHKWSNVLRAGGEVKKKQCRCLCR